MTAATIRRDLGVLDASMRSNHAEKVAIAVPAWSLILDADTLFLEGGTTVLKLARLLVSRVRLTVVTNSPAIVCILQRSSGCNVLCTGGDRAMGASAIDPAYGISTASHCEAQIKQAIVRAVKVSIDLADHSKFGKQGFAFVGPGKGENFDE